MLRARIEMLLAAIATVLTVVTLIWPTWIESLVGFEPDGGNGETEWWFALIFAVVAAVALVLARRDYVIARNTDPAPGVQ